ncbi:MAG: hypothetical protein ACYDBV_13020, partial [Nitrospiria bacterium]
FLAEMLELRAISPFDSSSLAYIYGLSVCTFMLPWIFLKPNCITTIQISDFVKDQENIIKFSIGIASILMICIVATVVFLGSLPIYSMMMGKMNIQDHIENIFRLPLGLLAVIALLTTTLALYLSSLVVRRMCYKPGKRVLTFLFISGVFASIWQGNRQFMLIFIFFLIARVNQTQLIKFTALKYFRNVLILSVIFICFIGISIGIQWVRLQGEGSNPYELLQYLVWPSLNILSIVNNVPSDGESIYPNFILHEIIPSRFVNSESTEDLKSIVFEQTSSVGYLSYWFLDYRYYGIIIGSLFLSWISFMVFSRRNKSEGWMRLYILILWCCATASIYSHFISINFFILPALFLIIQTKLWKTVHYFRK